MERNPMNLLLKPAPFNPTPYFPKFRFETRPADVSDDDADDDEIMVTIIAISERKGHR